MMMHRGIKMHYWQMQSTATYFPSSGRDLYAIEHYREFQKSCPQVCTGVEKVISEECSVIHGLRFG
jgi:hypothetical protein